MFTVEFVVVRGAGASVIEKTEFTGASLADADELARHRLVNLRLRPTARPDGYHIRNRFGAVVLRSWKPAIEALAG
jgi:hypothetical protein